MSKSKKNLGNSRLKVIYINREINKNVITEREQQMMREIDETFIRRAYRKYGVPFPGYENVRPWKII